MNVLEVKDIYKKIGKKDIINGINFSIKPGEIFGFLGPNGAGKTTTIRMIVGLIAPSKGNINIMGYDIQTQRTKALQNIGCIVENPDLYNDFTGLQNLKYYADLYGDITTERIEEVIDIIGLRNRINDKVKKYSLGMKQRLGLGQAILSKPRLLILDEPTNGLDPMGIHDFRNVVINAAKEDNTAVFISSHILSEIEHICNSYAIINNGCIQAIENVSNEKSMEEKISITTGRPNELIDILSKMEFIKDMELGNGKITLKIIQGNFSALIKNIGKSDIDIDNIYKVEDSLEDKFMKVINGRI